MNLSGEISRRTFVGTATAGAAGLVLTSCTEPAGPKITLESATLKTRPSAPVESVTPGMQALGLDPVRDGFLYVPPSYNPATPAPLLVLMHGASQSSNVWANAAPTLADEKGIIILAPDSAGRTWDVIQQGAYGPDVRFIDSALALVFGKCNINPARMALGGFSDGASYALSLGLSNGDLFPQLIAFSPGYTAEAGQRGSPRIFVSHGTFDRILPIDATSRRIVPALRRRGYQVEYQEFDGDHEVPLATAQSALSWFLPPATAVSVIRRKIAVAPRATSQES